MSLEAYLSSQSTGALDMTDQSESNGPFQLEPEKKSSITDLLQQDDSCITNMLQMKSQFADRGVVDLSSRTFQENDEQDLSMISDEIDQENDIEDDDINFDDEEVDDDDDEEIEENGDIEMVDSINHVREKPDENRHPVDENRDSIDMIEEDKLLGDEIDEIENFKETVNILKEDINLDQNELKIDGNHDNPEKAPQGKDEILSLKPATSETEKVPSTVDRIIEAVAKDEIDSYVGDPVIPKPEGEENKPKEKKPRKRKKKSETPEDKEKKKVKTLPNMRKNIREVLEDTDIGATTVMAQTEEMERKRRLQELKKSIMEKEQKEKDSQLKSLLEDNDVVEHVIEEKSNEVILLDSSDEGKMKKKDGDVIDISSDEDDEELMLTADDEDLVEDEDPNNCGNHIDDSLNHPDEYGRVLVNMGHTEDEDPIYLAPQIAKYIKRHQIGGVRFLFDNLIESISRFKSSPGFGCILAHSMGLGKTIQMISFIDVFLRYTTAKTVLLIVPINTLQNWLAEINMWCPESVPEGYPDVQLRNFKVYILNDNFKTPLSRAKVIVEWHKTGGCLLMGYEMYRLMTSRKGHMQQPKKGRKAPGKEMVIDVDEEDKTKDMFVEVHEALQSPGPDLIVCDEGHRIKNSHAGISQSLKNIKTRRRVVLTGYPLQNNLIEYWCMVDFVRPNYLGTKTEFSNMFERPIMNGQCADSTDADTKLMRYRAHVLHSLLEGFVQRRGHTVLQAALPPKQEYIFLVSMSQIQKMLYKEFMDNLAETSLNTWATTNPIKAFSVCCKIWNHPDILYKLLKVKKDLADDNDLDIDTVETSGGKKRGKKTAAPSSPSSAASSPASADKKTDQSITYEWAEKLLKDYTPGLLETGGKMVLLFNLIEQTLAAGDKLLIFSQSLFTLSLVEEMLAKCKVPRPDMDEYWCKNKNYFRLDGSTLAQEREKLIGQFNAYDNTRVWLFLLSTRAGSLGINLIGANRVVVMDASWNPCHDCQAVCRVYRFGQVRPTYIYRLVTDNTMERKIYDRQVNKQGMSDRVVDELNPQSNFCRRQVDNLLRYEDVETEPLDFSECDKDYDDEVMVRVLKKQGHWLTKKPFTHESLLIDKKELRLSKKEKRLAKQSYVMEKRLNLTYTRPSYAAFYPKGGGPPGVRPPHPPWNQQGTFNRPVASVKPIMSTPVPLKAKDGSTVIPQTKPGVTVHKIVTTTDITLPGTSTSTQSGGSASGGTISNKIPAGQQVFVIKTPKGVYIRTKEGKIFAVRAKTPLVGGISTASTTSVSTVTVKSTAGQPKVGTAQPIIVYPKNGSAVINRNPTSRQPRIVRAAVQNVNQNDKKESDSKSDSDSASKSSDMEVDTKKQTPGKIVKVIDLKSLKKREPENVVKPMPQKVVVTLSATCSSPSPVEPQPSGNSVAKIDSLPKVTTAVEPVSRSNVVEPVSRSNSQTSVDSQPRSDPEPNRQIMSNNMNNSAMNVERQNSHGSQLSSSDEGHVQFENNDSQFGSDFGAFDQSDNSNMSNNNGQFIDFDHTRVDHRQPGFLESLFDDSDIMPYQQNMDLNKGMSRLDSSASLSSNMGHIDLRDDSEKMNENDSFMSRYPRMAPHTMPQSYPPQQTNHMSHMYNPMSGYNQGHSQMGYNPMYPPYPVMFPPNSHQSQPQTTHQDGSSTNTSQNDFTSPLQNMSQMAQSPMMGFPFSPYPFPVPSPYMMGGMGNPYMPMGMHPYGHQGGMMPPPKHDATP